MKPSRFSPPLARRCEVQWTYVLEETTSLIDKSLLRQEGEDEPRISMLQTIREYAAEKLDERGERIVIAGTRRAGG